MSLLTFNEAKKYLRVSATTLYRFIHEKTIPAYKIGVRWKFRQEVLDKWLESHASIGQKKL
ncbi:MAG: DNA-binding protein [Candidatus Omnitrophica bacterium CG07_land_8_20_14_0_80_50_8]|nr:MAG: DNA-binding protein [Candidatus Omnitrophica bacterium CG07_land_8_20_14_0_80_50_8]